MAIEDEFGIQVSDEAAQKIRTVKDIVDYLDEQA
jgi:acyl carrier protein